MGKHSSERTTAWHRDASRDAGAGDGRGGSRPPRRTVLLLALAMTVTAVAWGVLVFAAIDFGGEARSGEPIAWFFLALASLGAAACLFLTMILGSRLLALLRPSTTSPPPPRVPGGRRAAR